MQKRGMNRHARGRKRSMEEEIVSEMPIRHQVYMQNWELNIETQGRLQGW